MRGSKSEGNLSVKLCKRTGNCKGGGIDSGKMENGGRGWVHATEQNGINFQN